MKSKEPSYVAAYWQRWRMKNQPPKPRLCSICQCEFLPHGPQKRCDKCRTLTCKQCGEPFIPQEARMSQMFCCRDCQNASRKGKFPPQLVGHRGVKPRTYHLRTDVRRPGRSFDMDWTQAVMKRDGYKCRRCGAKGRLQAHHIKPYADYPRLRYVLSNGLTLCISCHKRTKTYGWKGMHKERKRLAAKRLSQEVFDFA